MKSEIAQRIGTQEVVIVPEGVWSVSHQNMNQSLAVSFFCFTPNSAKGLELDGGTRIGSVRI